NNPLLNMAEARRLPVLKLMTPALAKFQPYIGQELFDEYLDKVIQSWAYLEGHILVLENANAGNFNDAVKCNILKSMMGEKYAPVPANNGLVVRNLAINSPDTYEIVADNDAQVLGFLKSHLTDDFYTWMRIANPCAPNLNGQVSQQSSYNTKIIEAPIILQSVFPIPDTQKMIDKALAKQKSNYDAEIEKLRKKVQFSKAQKTQTPVSQTVEL
ncbi:4993_t:CDS:2, partial [Diversispora eburnea]